MYDEILAQLTRAFGADCAVAVARPEALEIEAAIRLDAPEAVTWAPRRQREFSAGRRCAREALVRLGGPACPLPRGADRAPLWPKGFLGSISHCEGFCVAVAARTTDRSGLGVDAEPVGAVAARLRPAWICRPEELAQPPGLGGADLVELCFCAKEAVYKAWRQVSTRFLDFQDVSVELQHLRKARGGFCAQVLPETPDKGAPAARIEGFWLIEGGLLVAGCAIPAAGTPARAGARQR